MAVINEFDIDLYILFVLSCRVATFNCIIFAINKVALNRWNRGLLGSYIFYWLIINKDFFYGPLIKKFSLLIINQ